MKVEIEILTIAEQKPKDGEKVMVFNAKFKDWNPQYYNDYYNCWDDSTGDDYERDVQNEDRWFRLPQ